MTQRREEHQQGTLAEQFRQLCQSHDPPPDVFGFLESAPTTDPRARAEVLLVDQALRIDAGQLRPVEEYLARCPDVAQNEALSLELAAGEFHQRTHHGETIAVETFLARFPRLQHHLGRLLNSSPGQQLSPEMTVDVPMDFLLKSTGEINGEVPPAGLPPEAGEQTIDVPLESFLPEPTDEENLSTETSPRSTLEWEPTEADFEPDTPPGDDTSHDTSKETMDMDSQSFSEMFEQFGTVEVSGTYHTQATSPRRRRNPNMPDTMFEEGVAYDRDRQLGRFGEYELLSEIARGGMGVVFKARQRKLKRIVALKMILAGNLADAEDIRRFYAEAEASAALDHPHIVPVYEVGEYRGQHFFSMGYVEGQSLAEKIADHPLSAQEAARMMKLIAEAVEYAHQHGVIHRDLKPANVLLDTQEQPKITDFGLAKRTEADAELTTTGQIMGTPSYMAPEQITGDSRQVGPLSDVFSMGAMLYCLLTGRPPFQAPTLLDLLQQVQHQEPVSPRRLTSNLPADLETICLKCLAKEPIRRYQSAQALADDLDRFLNGIPVLARPVGQTERVWRWCKRYPVVAGLIAAVILSLMSGAAVSTYYAIAANRRAKEAMQQSERAERNFERAERNFLKAQAAVDQFFVQVSENTLLNQPGMQPLQHKLLNQALVYYQTFLEERGDDPGLQDELAITNFRVGIITEMVESPQAAIPAFEKARELQTALLKENPGETRLLQGLGDTLTALGRVYYRTKGYHSAEEIYQQAVATRQQLVDDLPNDHEAQRELANAYMNLGLVERGRAQSLTDPVQQTAALEEALTFYTKAQQLRRDLLDHAELSPDTRRKVHRDFGQGGYNLGTLHLQMGNLEPGLKSYQEAAAQFEKALQIDPEDQNTTLQLAICYHALATGETDRNRAWSMCETALSHLEPLVRANPGIADYQKELVALRMDMGNIARELNRPDEAARQFQESRALIDPLLQSRPKDLKLLLKAMILYRNLLELAAVGQADSPEVPPLETFEQIADQVQQRVIAQNSGGRLRGDFAVELFQLAHHLNRHGHRELAVQLSRYGVSITGQLVEEDSPDLDHHHNHQIGLGQLGRLLSLNGQNAEARETYRKRVAALSELAMRIPDTPATLFERAQLDFEKAKTNNALAKLSIDQQNWQEAQEDLQEAQRLIGSLISQFPQHRAFFEQELNHTKLLRALLPLQPATAEKPKPSSPPELPHGDVP